MVRPQAFAMHDSHGYFVGCFLNVQMRPTLQRDSRKPGASLAVSAHSTGSFEFNNMSSIILAANYTDVDASETAGIVMIGAVQLQGGVFLQPIYFW